MSHSSAPFIHDEFLLEGQWASRLYHGFAQGQPVIDYHCHLSPQQIFENHRFRSITELWLEGDHYKWRAMRAAGVDEHLITGDADDWEKFLAWSKVVPKTLRNPLYHWTHMELSRPFGIDELLDERSARTIYDACNERLSDSAFFAQGLLEEFQVRVVCTTDDPVDDLCFHRAHRKTSSSLRLLPTFRPDAALAIEEPTAYVVWLSRLEQASEVSVSSYSTLLEALAKRHAFFHDSGCKISDHGLDQLYVCDASLDQAERAFDKVRHGQACSLDEVSAFKSVLLLDLARMDHSRGWAQQFHLGALRNVNTRKFAELGPNTGFDAMDDQPMAQALARFLDQLEQTDQLAKTILYNLNPKDSEVFATMAGVFQKGPTIAKVQYGAAWWFLDQLDGMEKQSTPSPPWVCSQALSGCLPIRAAFSLTQGTTIFVAFCATCWGGILIAVCFLPMKR